ncbi:activating signal cointegrator 1 complex subunit 3 isoform X1 [Scyliorhinus canicula]|uniref:activating signal cointegrator 1 complex subunit 3 isoform X1 n=1 Tax=Scyliorhinus canicula TaxID=7830 RepID=UPI0018F42ECC|nr:activating signal cointegrator 1 complex subunit 3 isoform X1 [Scyliorhinus canicula]XP_038655201.1 activating signal cointegrator 1 complex subunit 3 isoform X1 [Scyliorhinus canicula]XP_038655202.1 activating signal cointegrator 1 complex subunit 3 isoform X1 [Scyliorhinus canicula]
MELPRLTGALRSFSNVTRQDEYIADSSEMMAKRSKRKDHSCKTRLTWKDITHLVEKVAQTEHQNVGENVKNLLKAARQLVGIEQEQETVESAAVFLFKFFHDKDHVGHEETKAVKQMFGPFPPSAATAACNAAYRIASNFSEEELQKLVCADESASQISRVHFGKNINFSFDSFALEPSGELPLNCESYNQKDFSLDYDKYFSNHQGDLKNGSIDNPDLKCSNKVDGSFLRQEVDRYIIGILQESSDRPTTDDLCETLLEMLASNKSDDELQNELFELLGAEGLELIEKLLQQRRTIVEKTLTHTTDLKLSYLQEASKKGIGGNAQPIYGCQVTVQSEQEKQLLKQYRREEKRLAKREKKDEGEFSEGLQYFDPKELRSHREHALQSARIAPILTRQHDYERIHYPNVYDSKGEAMQSAAFIAGAKMLLPEDVERENNKVYEQVAIPATQPMPTGIQEKPIDIKNLDEIGQLVFKGLKRLNRIQSIVFETAYNTNENMLICAPTGAGKTNIAMLTVLHEIRQHIQQGVIRKDEFKIIYVAPMKALAAEMTNYFSKRLEPLGILVKELTGDMQLTKGEILRTQMLVTTPEKWDVVTRKSVGDVALSQIVRLLILDEVHLLHEDRGPVLESLVARTLRQVESTQSMIRILGLSATLPNFLDVATFLHVNPYIGLFFFDGRFRPVPLKQTFIGVKASNKMQQLHDMEEVCYEKVLIQLKEGHQVMVFVHARNSTVRTAMALQEMAKNQGDIMYFAPNQSADYGSAEKQIQKSRNKQLRELFPDGFGIHHAGMLRQDRNLVESCFSRGHIKVLVCTATLAWGVNLPAHAVIIKGTQIYDAKRGSFVDLGILDVMQIFGRAGRPQFDKFGEGTIITAHDKLSHYLTLLTQQNPIESQFLDRLADNLNAEIALGTVTNVEEAVKWLSYTYLYVRTRANPLAYGINYKAYQMDPGLEKYRQELVIEAGQKLDKARMVRFEARTGYFSITDLGRTASHYYIQYNTIETFNELFSAHNTEADVFALVSKAEEFEQIKIREEEMEELDQLLCNYCELPVAGGVENTYGKVNILLQTYIGHGELDSFSLISDTAYVAQNAARIVRALFEVALRRRWPAMTYRLLNLCKIIDKRLWGWCNPLRQFSILPGHVLAKLEEKKLTIDKMKDMRKDEIGHMLHHVNIGLKVKQCVHEIPSIALEASIQPITRTVLRVRLTITPDFKWHDQTHGSVGEPWWIWVEDPVNDHIYHSEYFLLQKKQVLSKEQQLLVFTIPIFEPLPSQYYIRAVSDRWLGAEAVCIINFQHLILPERHPPHTELLDLQPLPINALGNREYEALYKFTHFNPIQTQIFHTLYHTDCNVLLGAPTGSGKTVAAELAIFRIFNKYPTSKAVYIAPLKALVRERIEDWKIRITEKLGKNVVELTGDVTPDMKAITQADLIVTTPEKWDGISRSWQNRGYVKKVSIIIIDEIHLLGDERGPVLEVIVSRASFISSHTNSPVRIVGLSTALANAKDLADWLGIRQNGLFNFRPSVRPVPLEVHIHGFPGQHYCPRMASMNKPTFQAIRSHSPSKPVLIFVSSRRQTRLTALDLIAFLAAEDDPKQWLHMDEREMSDIIEMVRDSNLKLTLAFGIGLHHAGLHEHDRKHVEELFVNCKIQILIATSTLAWGVNFPAHLVIVKGTEYYDGKTRRYVDFAITDVLQMMGRAGRPQFDDQGKAVILVHDIKKDFYKKFLYEPFPVESSLLEVLSDHMNAEISAGTVSSKQDAMDYITWTYFFRRLIMNPSYYNLDDINHDTMNKYLSNLVEKSLADLECSYCISVGEDSRSLQSLDLGRIASYYYLKHQTMKMFKSKMKADCCLEDLLSVLTDATEYADLPVRHNEDQLNSDLAKHLPIEVNPHSFDSAHTKAHLLLQAHFCRAALPCPDYATDTKSVLDQAIRICQSMLDVAANNGWLVTALNIINLIQMVIQGRWVHDSSLLTLPNIEQQQLYLFRRCNAGKRKSSSKGYKGPIECLPELIAACECREDIFHSIVADELQPIQISQTWKFLSHLPIIEVNLNIKGWWENAPKGKSEKPLPNVGTGFRDEKNWTQLHADQEYVLQINLCRIGLFRNKGKYDSKASTPRFPKAKDEGWFIILGEVDKKELVALKRVGYIRNRSTVCLAFYTPEATGRYIYTLYLMNDSYLGMDQQYDIYLDVIPASIYAQVNTEISDARSDLTVA